MQANHIPLQQIIQAIEAMQFSQPMPAKPAAQPGSAMSPPMTMQPQMPTVPPAPVPPQAVSRGPADVSAQAEAEYQKADALRRSALGLEDPKAPSGFGRPGETAIMAAIAALGGAADPFGGSGMRFLNSYQDGVRSRQAGEYAAGKAKNDSARAQIELDARAADRQGDTKLKAGMAELESDLQGRKLAADAIEGDKDRISREKIAQMGVHESDRRVLMSLPVEARPAYARDIMKITSPDVLAGLAGLTPKDKQLEAQALKTTEQATTEQQTRAGKIANLLSTGKLTEANVLLAGARTETEKLRATWMPKEAAAKIAQLNASAQKSLKDADNQIVRLENAALKQTRISQKDYYSAIDKVTGARGEAVGLLRRYEEEARLMADRLARLKSGELKSFAADGRVLSPEEGQMQLSTALENNALERGYLEAKIKRMDAAVGSVQSRFGIVDQGTEDPRKAQLKAFAADAIQRGADPKIVNKRLAADLAKLK